jgi:hypothetical protein
MLVVEWYHTRAPNLEVGRLRDILVVEWYHTRAPNLDAWYDALTIPLVSRVDTPTTNEEAGRLIQ